MAAEQPWLRGAGNRSGCRCPLCDALPGAQRGMRKLWLVAGHLQPHFLRLSPASLSPTSHKRPWQSEWGGEEAWCSVQRPRSRGATELPSRARRCCRAGSPRQALTSTTTRCRRRRRPALPSRRLAAGAAAGAAAMHHHRKCDCCDCCGCRCCRRSRCRQPHARVAQGGALAAASPTNGGSRAAAAPTAPVASVAAGTSTSTRPRRWGGCVSVHLLPLCLFIVAAVRRIAVRTPAAPMSPGCGGWHHGARGRRRYAGVRPGGMCRGFQLLGAIHLAC